MTVEGEGVLYWDHVKTIQSCRVVWSSCGRCVVYVVLFCRLVSFYPSNKYHIAFSRML